MRYVWIALVSILSFSNAGCRVEHWLTTRLHVLQAEQGVFTEIGETGVYMLNLSGAADEVRWFTDRPRRDIGSESLDRFTTDTWFQVIAGESPTGAVSYQDGEGYWRMMPFKAISLDTGPEPGQVTWQLELKGAPDCDTVRDVHIYLDDRAGSETGEGDSYVFLHGAAHIAFEPQEMKNRYTLRLSYPYPTVSALQTSLDFGVYVLPMEGFIESVWSGDFVANPPNAAIQIEGLDGETHVFIAVLSAPAYDPATDELVYQAELLSDNSDLTTGPGVLFIDDWTNDDGTTLYEVVMNHEEQYSIWPAHKETPLGWSKVGKMGTIAECLAYIKEVWTDMRPLSLREQMEKMEQAAAGNGVIVTTSGSVTILSFRGKITIGMGSVLVRNAVLQTLDNGVQRIVLNLADVTVIDSSGIGELVSAYTSAINRGASLVLANVPQATLDILTLTQLSTVFQIYDSVELAVQALEE